ncbi:MAG: hypothetical protein H6712_19605 [Myxococcales bacterium]|nr:hypothetical protein [Myxococcales bacterium]
MAPLLIHLRRTALAVLLLALACKGDDPQAEPRTPVESPPAPTPAASPETAAAPAPKDDGVRSRLLAWLDPDAVSVAWVSVPQTLRGDVVSVVYGLPPRAEDLLQAVTDLERALESVRPSEAPATSTWLGSTALVSTGRLARRPTVIRPLLEPLDEVRKHLQALELRRAEDEVFEIWEPQRVFPYRVILLEGDVAAFVPASEPGSGLTPLAAARDMPPSDVQEQLDALLGQPGAPAIALFASGPMLHLDLDQDVLAVRFELLRGSDGSLDGQIALQLEGDAAAAVAALEGRKAPEQNDRVRELVDRAAYLADGEVVQGRLQLPPADAALLRAEP